jgi:hypothetical protein
MKKFFLYAFVTAFLLAQAGCAASTRLGGAAKGGDIREVTALLSEGADVNENGMMGASPLYEAILYQAPFDIIQLLINKGADVNRGIVNGWKPIHLAVKNNDAEVVGLLLERGAHTGVRNPHGETPLRMAEQKGNTAIARMIRDAEEKKYQSVVGRRQPMPSQNAMAPDVSRNKGGSRAVEGGENPLRASTQVAGESRPGKELGKIVVWDLVPRNTPVTHAAELTSILVSEIGKLGLLEVYSQENVRTLAGWTAEKMQLGCTDSKCLTALGQMDVSRLISGSVGKIGDRYSISLNLFDTQNTRSERSVSEFCRSENDLIELVQTAVRKLLR